jgi:DNA polymerase III alpha subunit
MLKDPKNIVEQRWKTRILYESTPRGNIAMYYDVYKQGFSYYSDQNGIPYPILNAAAMKYVMMFYCKDFFMDEKTMTQSLSIEDKNGDDKDKNHISPLIKIYETDEIEEKEKERKEKEKKEQEKESQNEESTLKNKDAPFAKLKNYKMTPNVNKNTKKEETNKVLFKNKFIYLGKMRNFSFLQKKPIVKNPLEVSSEYDGLFSGEKMSYKDYKMKQINYSDFKKRKQEEYTLHTLLKPILGNTYGILIYQEQVMKMLNVVGKIPLKDCETIRKAISKKKISSFIKYKEIVLFSLRNFYFY